MNDTQKTRIIQAERLHGGLVITFDDGRSFLFESDTLRAYSEHALDITDLPYVGSHEPPPVKALSPHAAEE